MTQALLQLRNVSKVYAKAGAAVRALDGVALDVQAGEYLALLGPSGSGKSTLMNVLGCLDQPTQGRFRFAGVDVGELSPAALAEHRRQVGFVFQSFHLLPGLSALDNVALPLRYSGVAPDERQARAQAVLAQVGLADRAQHRPNELSGGQQQRVAVARALVADPKLVLADEPTGNLDTKSGGEVVELIESLWQQGRTVIVVTHDDRLAARARRVVRMLDGKIVADTRR